MKFHHVLPDLLGTRAKTRVLDALLSFPTRHWTGRELARHARVSPPQTQEALRTFEAYGLASWRAAGKSRVWTLETQHVFVPALRSLLSVRQNFQTAFLNGLRHTLRPSLFRKIQEITLYGSVARGEDLHGSDVDIFVRVSDPAIVEDVRQACLGVSVDLLDRFDKVTMPLVWSPLDFTGKNPHLLRNIRHDGITFYGSVSV